MAHNNIVYTFCLCWKPIALDQCNLIKYDKKCPIIFSHTHTHMKRSSHSSHTDWSISKIKRRMCDYHYTHELILIFQHWIEQKYSIYMGAIRVHRIDMGKQSESVSIQRLTAVILTKWIDWEEIRNPYLNGSIRADKKSGPRTKIIDGSIAVNMSIFDVSFMSWSLYLHWMIKSFGSP